MTRSPHLAPRHILEDILFEQLRAKRHEAAHGSTRRRLTSQRSEGGIMIRITALYGSPRRQGNTATLMDRAVEGAREAGAQMDRIFLRDLNISPCLEIYGCRKNGRCVIQDDFHPAVDKLLHSQGIMLASPIFFYTVSAHTKIFMDRCQSLWVKRYWIDGTPFGAKDYSRLGFFVSTAASHGKKLFDGALLTVRYFFDVLDAGLWDTLLVRGVDAEKDILKHPDLLIRAREKGKEFVRAVADMAST